eukprot:g2702.t1
MEEQGGPSRQIPIVCPGHSRPLAELQFSPVTPDGVFLISACLDKQPMLRRGDTGDWIGTFAGHKGAVWSAKLDKSAHRAATAGADFCAKLWDAISGEEKREFGHKHIVKSVEFTDDGTRLLSGSTDKTVKVWSLEDDKAEPTVLAHPDGVRKILACPGADLCLTGAQDGVVRLWDLRTSTVVREARVPALVMDMELLPSDGSVLTVAAGKCVTFLDGTGAGGPSLGLLKQHTLAMKAGISGGNAMPTGFLEEGGASLHPGKKRFVAGGSDLYVRVYDYDSGAELECLKGHHGPIRCVRYAPGGAAFASGSEDGTIRIWQTDAAVPPAAAGDAATQPPAPPAQG